LTDLNVLAHTFHAYNLQTVFCRFRASAYTNVDGLCAVFLDNIFLRSNICCK